MTRALIAVALSFAWLTACAPRFRAPPVLPPLGDEAEVFVYLQPFPEDAARLSVKFGAVALARPDGAEEPLHLELEAASGADAGRQRLLASGRVPAGAYGSLIVRVTGATLAGERPVDLLVPGAPARIDLGLALGRGRGAVVQLQLAAGQAGDEEFGFAGDFSAAVGTPQTAVVQLAGYVSSPHLATLTVFDRRSRQVTAAIPTGREPQGLALDVLSGVGYLALSGEDQIELLDLATGADLRRLRLRTGDAPREVALTPDGRLLVVVNTGSNSVAFVDAQPLLESSRVSVSLEPGALLLDREGRRAFVLGRRTNELTVIDLATRAVVAVVPTDPEPLRASLNRAEDRLYVVQRGSVYMTVFSLPSLAVLNRIPVGLGASAVKVDPRTDLVYVAHSDESRLQVFDPFSLLPLDSIAVRAPVSWMVIDDTENALVCVMPSVRGVAFVDLVRRRVTSEVEVGAQPFQATVVGERP